MVKCHQTRDYNQLYIGYLQLHATVTGVTLKRRIIQDIHWPILKSPCRANLPLPHVSWQLPYTYTCKTMWCNISCNIVSYFIKILTEKLSMVEHLQLANIYLNHESFLLKCFVIQSRDTNTLQQEIFEDNKFLCFTFKIKSSNSCLQ